MTEGSVRRITWRSSDVARVLTLVALFLFLWKFFWLVHSAVFVALLAVLIAIVLHQPARFLSRWIPFRLAFPLIVLLFLGAIAGLLVALIPQLVEQVTLLATTLPQALNDAAVWFESKTDRPVSPELADRVSAQAGEFVGRFVPIAFNAISTALGSFALVVLAIFFAAEPRTYRDLFLGFVSPETRETAARLYDEAGRSLRNWTIGKALSMVAIGVCTWIGLTLFEIPGALALAVFAALMEFIPNFGPTIAAVPAIIAAFLISPATAFWVAVFYFGLQQVQNGITVPLVERRAVNIPPAALLVWQLMLAVGFGILALFVATPLLAVLVVAVKILYLEPAERRYAWDRRDAGDHVPGREEVDVAHPDPDPPLPVPPPGA